MGHDGVSRCTSVFRGWLKHVEVFFLHFTHYLLINYDDDGVPVVTGQVKLLQWARAQTHSRHRRRVPAATDCAWYVYVFQLSLPLFVERVMCAYVVYEVAFCHTTCRSSLVWVCKRRMFNLKFPLHAAICVLMCAPFLRSSYITIITTSEQNINFSQHWWCVNK